MEKTVPNAMGPKAPSVVPSRVVEAISDATHWPRNVAVAAPALYAIDPPTTVTVVLIMDPPNSRLSISPRENL